MIWSHIPTEAILHILPLGRLLDLWDADRGVRDLLQLQLFKPGQKTYTVASRLRNKKQQTMCFLI